MYGALIGATAGLVLAWVIAATRSRFTYLGRGVGQFAGMSCAATSLLYLVFAVIGALVGAVLLR